MRPSTGGKGHEEAMKKFIAKAACAVALAGSAMALPAMTAPADAAVCTHNGVWVGWTQEPSSTTQVAATNTCGNMWSVRAYSFNENVKGQFKNNGVWTDSTAGKKWTTTDSNAQQIVLDLIDGEPLRALGFAGEQTVLLWY